jgi:hypothetical protein
MLYLGAFKKGVELPYLLYFHDDYGQLADPTTPTARLRDPAGTWSSATAPAKQDAQTGLFGGVIDTADLEPGLHNLAVKGTVPTARAVGCVIAFHVIANTEDDLVSLFGAATVTIASPVAAGGLVTLHAGDDYSAEHARSINFHVTDAAHALGLDNVAAVVRFKATQATWAAVSVGSDATGYLVSFEATAEQTALLTLTRQPYELEATLADGDVVTLARGNLTVVT